MHLHAVHKCVMSARAWNALRALMMREMDADKACPLDLEQRERLAENVIRGMRSAGIELRIGSTTVDLTPPPSDWGTLLARLGSKL